MAADVVVIDYGSGNVRSMVNALQRVARDDQKVVLTGDPAALAGCERAVLPGVGAFGEVKRKLEASQLIPHLVRLRDSGRPILGVCVGMQILADAGEEFGHAAGLGWVKGVVRQLEVGAATKLPHYGWSAVNAKPDAPLFDQLPSGSHFYFVHSFALACSSADDVEATASYGAATFAASVRHLNVVGTQFHPEKSDVVGLQLLGNFCRWKG